MFPSPQQSPKKGHRVGGASFSKPRRVPGQPLSARSPAKPGASTAAAPLSARDAPKSGRQDGSLTPCQGRAEEYYSQLLGDPGQPGHQLKAEHVRHDWTLVQEIDSLDHFNLEEQKKRQVKEKNIKHQDQLKEQLRARRQVTEKCRDVWKQWRTELEDDVLQYEKEEESKKVYVKEAQKRFNQERTKQLEEIRQRKALQKEEDEKMERRMIEQAEEAKRRQDAADLERKTQQRKNMLYMKEESQQAVIRRQAAKDEDKKRDIKMQQEYETMLEAQEAARGQYFQSIRDKQSALLAKYEQGVGNKIALLAAEDDERARKHREAKDRKETQDAEEKARWRRQLAESGRIAVQNQLAMQAEERQRQREEDQRYLDKLRKESEIAEAKEIDKQRRKKEAVYANAEFIRKQMRDKEMFSPSKKALAAQMNDVEKQINREKLERATDRSREDGLQSLLGKKRAEYRAMHLQNPKPVALPS